MNEPFQKYGHMKVFNEGATLFFFETVKYNSAIEYIFNEWLVYYGYLPQWGSIKISRFLNDQLKKTSSYVAILDLK